MNRKTLAGDRRRRKLLTLLWALGLSVAVILLIYFEHTAILYIVCTLGVAALLLIVAFSDLKHEGGQDAPLVQSGDAARVANRSK
jgi:heme O synthase-like polyprenyltransferase